MQMKFTCMISTLSVLVSVIASSVSIAAERCLEKAWSMQSVSLLPAQIDWRGKVSMSSADRRT